MGSTPRPYAETSDPNRATDLPDTPGDAATPAVTIADGDAANSLGAPQELDSSTIVSSPRRRAVAALLAVAFASSLALVGYSVFRASVENAATPPTVTVTVQNLVTEGPYMREDTAAYLSSRPMNSCQSKGCAVPGQSFRTGDQLQVACHVAGERTTNGNDGEIADDLNPRLYTSTRWYGAPLRTGGTGYISEVWLSPDDRGGHGLPVCT
jgi:hypothetical protein